MIDGEIFCGTLKHAERIHGARVTRLSGLLEQLERYGGRA